MPLKTEGLEPVASGLQEWLASARTCVCIPHSRWQLRLRMREGASDTTNMQSLAARLHMCMATSGLFAGSSIPLARVRRHQHYRLHCRGCTQFTYACGPLAHACRCWRHRTCACLCMHACTDTLLCSSLSLWDLCLKTKGIHEPGNISEFCQIRN